MPIRAMVFDLFDTLVDLHFDASDTTEVAGRRVHSFVARLHGALRERAEVDLETFMDELREQGDSIGAKVSVLASNIPVGLGEPVFDKLEADLARGLMSINAVKGVELGAGFAAVTQRGSQHRDEMSADGFNKNDAGGTLGGISSGQDLLASIALKPTSSVSVPGKTIDTRGKETEIVTKGRHDPCVGLRATPIAEAMVALVLMDHYMRNRAQNAEVSSATPEIS